MGAGPGGPGSSPDGLSAEWLGKVSMDLDLLPIFFYHQDSGTTVNSGPEVTDFYGNSFG